MKDDTIYIRRWFLCWSTNKGIFLTKKIGDANRKPVYYNCDNCGKECVTKPS